MGLSGQRRKKYVRRPLLRMIPIVSSVLLVACTRTCVGNPELGSRRFPVRFSLGTQGRPQPEALENISNCIESAVGFRVRFEVAADEKAAAAVLGRGEAHFSYLSSLSYVAAAAKYELAVHRVRLEAGAPAVRSVILGFRKTWAEHLASQKISMTAAGLRSENALNIIENGRFLFVHPESDVGFFVPRALLFQRNVFPSEAAFAGSDELVLQGLERGLGVAGALSESWLRQHFSIVQPVRPGLVVSDFLVIDVSPSLPGKVVVSRRDLPQRVQSAVIKGLDICSKDQNAALMTSVFGGDAFGSVSERVFSYVRELYEVQETFLRVLVPREL
jgi:ABC-type phosphate/phosphonate transport system substrate-binding protein